MYTAVIYFHNDYKYNIHVTLLAYADSDTRNFKFDNTTQ